MAFDFFRRRRGQVVSHGEHELKVYGGDFPAAEVARFLRTGLDNGESGLVIATPENAFRIRQALGAGQEKVVFLDAAAKLSSFMVGGRPDPARFHAQIGPALHDAQHRGNGGVRAYGEMVALLAEHGQHEAAVEVEHLWNLVLHGQPVALLCAYPTHVFAGLAHKFLADVQHEHAPAMAMDA